MRLLITVFGSVLLLGCPTTPEPLRQPPASTVPLLLAPPIADHYIDSSVEKDTTGARRYSAALSGYVEYLNGHIRYINMRYGVGTTNQTPCPVSFVGYEVSVPVVPNIDSGLSPDEIIEKLLDYIDVIYLAIGQHNNSVRDAQRLHQTYCPGIPLSR